MKSTSRPSQAGYGCRLLTMRWELALAGFFLSASLPTAFAQGQTYRILYSFQCGSDGDKPLGGLVRDSAGNLYGTTVRGGALGLGTVFEISASDQETVLYSFGTSPTDGQSPTAGLTRDSADSLYGTTEGGGSSGVGTVFKVSTDGTESVLYSFGQTATDGQYPEAGLILDPVGNLYGTTSAGGVFSSGTVFELSPGGVETVLHSFEFNSTTDGNTPYAGLVRDLAGNLYGTTFAGGTFDAGTVFKVTAKAKEAVLHDFGAAGDGGEPLAGLLRDAAGNLYGTTRDGGVFSNGAVFELRPTGTESVFFSFGSAGGGGYSPGAGLIEDMKGNFYGTAETGGIFENGVVFKLSAAGQETVFHRFTGSPQDGSKPAAGLVRDSAGNLYGTTSTGGTGGCGTVFKIAP